MQLNQSMATYHYLTNKDACTSLHNIQSELFLDLVRANLSLNNPVLELDCERMITCVHVFNKLTYIHTHNVSRASQTKPN